MKTRRIRCLWIVLFCWCIKVAHAQEPLSYGDRVEIDRAKFLCGWRQGRTPNDNPQPLDICRDPTLSTPQVAAQVRSWWEYLHGLDDAAATSLEKLFEDAWRQTRTEEAKEFSRREAATEESGFARSATRLTSDQLCRHYAQAHSKAARSELTRRSALTEAEWSLAIKRQIQIGISELALVCSWGPTRSNRTVTALGTRKQYIYGDGSTYVYVENGIVVALQD